MSIFNLINRVTFACGLIGLVTVPTVVNAAVIDFDTWNWFGDVTTTSLGSASLSNNALLDDDFPESDSDFDFFGDPAIDSVTLESSLGLSPGSLDPDGDNFIQATEGSGLTNLVTFTEPTQLTFGWQFLTNDTTFIDGNGFRFADYGFVFSEDMVETIASTDSTLAPSSTNYTQEATGTYRKIFAPGTYDLGMGVVDVDDFDRSSALVISNAQTKPVPESSSYLSIILFTMSLGMTMTHPLTKKRN